MRFCFNVQLPDQDLVVGQVDWQSRSMRGHHDRQYTRFYPLMLALEALTKINVWQLSRLERNGVQLPPLYESGVFYQAEPPGGEGWLDIPHLYQQGHGDCEDLACARSAELRKQGIAAVPAIRSKRVPVSGRGYITLVHVLVLLPNGEEEDPSKRLGMQGEY